MMALDLKKKKKNRSFITYNTSLWLTTDETFVGESQDKMKHEWLVHREKKKKKIQSKQGMRRIPCPARIAEAYVSIQYSRLNILLLSVREQLRFTRVYVASPTKFVGTSCRSCESIQSVAKSTKTTK